MNVDFIKRHFFLQDGRVHRISNGKPVALRGSKSYPQVSVRIAGTLITIRLHRVKFALEHGYLPPVVDHKNRDVKDCSSKNLRPATKSLNSVNAPVRKQDGLPRGVRKHANKFKAYVYAGGKQRHLGSFTTSEEAAAVASRARAEAYGEFHRDD